MHLPTYYFNDVYRRRQRVVHLHSLRILDNAVSLLH